MWSETLASDPTIAPSNGAIASIRSHFVACLRSPDWLSTKLTVLRPSAKSWLMTATKTRNPVAESRPKASPIPSPSMKLWMERPSEMPLRRGEKRLAG